MAAQVQDVDLTLQLGQPDDKLHNAAKDVLQRLLPEWSEVDKSNIKVQGQVPHADSSSLHGKSPCAADGFAACARVQKFATCFKARQLEELSFVCNITSGSINLKSVLLTYH